MTDTGAVQTGSPPQLVRDRAARGGAPRTVLVTGAGGAGVSTVAVATALAGTRLGHRTLLVTRDDGTPGASPWPAGTPTAPRPVTDVPGLWAAAATPARDLARWVATLQQHGHGLLELLGTDGLAAEELTELPGVAQATLLAALRAGHEHDPPWDLVVVDLPPLAQAVQLLALPERLRRYLRRLLPPERQAARALHPLLAQLAGVPMPAAGLYRNAARLDAELTAVQRVTASGGTTVRLVLEPGPRGAHVLRSARARLALLGVPLDAVVANRLWPPTAGDDRPAGLAARQHEALTELRAALRSETAAAPGQAPVPLCTLPHLGLAVEGRKAWRTLVPHLTPGLTGWTDEVTPEPWSLVDELATEGRLLWRLPLPGAVREELDLLRRGGELIVDVGTFRRILPLPSALRRCTVVGARLADGVLTVRFRPDPALWPDRARGE